MAKIRPAMIAEALPLLTLAALDVLGETIAGVVDRPSRVISVHAVWNLELLTAGDGPIEVGIAHSDYTDAEIEEALEAVGSWGSDDKVTRERASRLVRKVGVLTEENPVLNDGEIVKTRLNWGLASGSTIRYWARNLGPTMQTGSSILFNGTAWIRP